MILVLHATVDVYNSVKAGIGLLQALAVAAAIDAVI